MAELGRQLSGVATIPAVADDDDDRSMSEHAARPLAIEVAERGADARATAEVVHTLGDRVEHLVDVALAQQARDAREARREDERLEVLAARHRVRKDHQQPRVPLHRAADVADEAKGLARSGDIGSGRLRPGITPAVMRGSGGAQKMSNAASKVGMSSLRLTNTVRSALRKSTSRFMSMWTSARVASVSRRGPASRPASCSSLAKAPSRGSRSGRREASSGTLCLLDQGRHLLAHPLQVFLVLEGRA